MKIERHWNGWRTWGFGVNAQQGFGDEPYLNEAYLMFGPWEWVLAWRTRKEPE